MSLVAVVQSGPLLHHMYVVDTHLSHFVGDLLSQWLDNLLLDLPGTGGRVKLKLQYINWSAPDTW